MRHILLYIACFMLSVAHGAATDSLRIYTVEQVPNVHISDKRQYVSDPANILSKRTRDSINTTLASLEALTGIETAVVMLPSIGKDEPFGFSHKLLRHWGVGKKDVNNGLVILFIKDIKQVRFTTGYGLEGHLPDIACKRIQTRHMIPAFKKGDYDTGMLLGTKAIYNVLKDSMRPNKKNAKTDSWFEYMFIPMAILIVIFITAYLNKKQRRCPRCGKNTLRKMSSTNMKGRHGNIIRQDTYICDHCGHITTRNNDTGSGSGTAGMLMDSLLIGSLLGRGHGRSFGGGSFGGGSFGGGDSGGGGADSGW